MNDTSQGMGKPLILQPCFKDNNYQIFKFIEKLFVKVFIQGKTKYDFFTYNDTRILGKNYHKYYQIIADAPVSFGPISNSTNLSLRVNDKKEEESGLFMDIILVYNGGFNISFWLIRPWSIQWIGRLKVDNSNDLFIQGILYASENFFFDFVQPDRT